MSSSMDLPVISETMIADWHRAGRHTLASQVRLGTSPTILGPDLLGPYDVRIWRRKLPAEIVEFAEKSGDIAPGYVGSRLSQFFHPRRTFSLIDGKIKTDADVTGSREHLTAMSLHRRLHHSDMPVPLTKIFASHIIDTLTTFLTVTPYPRLALEESFVSYRHAASFRSHQDQQIMLLLHFTDPATCYPMDLTKSTVALSAWRVQAGDINLHAPCTHHWFASHPRVNDVIPQRICLAFKAYTS